MEKISESRLQEIRSQYGYIPDRPSNRHIKGTTQHPIDELLEAYDQLRNDFYTLDMGCNAVMQQRDAMEALVSAVSQATWDESITGHAIVGQHSWARIQAALEKIQQRKAN